MKGNGMKRVKSTVSKATSYTEMGEYWDKHDLSDTWENTDTVEFEFIAEPQVTYFAVERSLSEKLRCIASSQGMSADTILNLWIQEKMLSVGR
jgi:hypothetical protein